MWFIAGVEVEQETSAPLPKKNPGSAPVIKRWIFRILYRLNKLFQQTSANWSIPGGEGVLPYIRYTGMCRPKGYFFFAVLV